MSEKDFVQLLLGVDDVKPAEKNAAVLKFGVSLFSEP